MIFTKNSFGRAIFVMNQVKLSAHEDRHLKVNVKSKASCSNVAPLKNRLAWYVELKANPSEEKLSRIPQIKWKIPRKFVLNNDWRVAAGEESHEREAQRYRDATVPEAVYSDLCVIPPSPLTSLDMGDKYNDDSQIPIIPVIPIEEAAAVEMPFDTPAPASTCINSQSLDRFRGPSASASLPFSPCIPSVPQNSPSLLNLVCSLQGSDLAVAAAAAATVAAAVESKQQIDAELLIRILSDPEMVKKLINESTIGAANIEPNTSVPLSSLTPDLAVDISRPVAVRQSVPMPSTKTVTAIEKSTTEQGTSLAGRASTICTSEPLEKPQSSRASPSKNVTNEARGHARAENYQFCGKPLIPQTLNHNENIFERVTTQHGVPFIDGMKPLAPLYPSASKPNGYQALISSGIQPVALPPLFPSTSRSYMEERCKMINDITTDVVMPSADLHGLPRALESNFASTGTLRSYPFSSMTLSSSTVEDTNYGKSGAVYETEEHKLPKYNHLHGLEKAKNSKPIELNCIYQKPCLYFNSTRGCHNGSNCRYMHAMSSQRMADQMFEAPILKTAKYHEQNWKVAKKWH